MLLWLKACPKCGGDLHLYEDIYGWYKQCLQCAYLIDVEAPIKKEGGNRGTAEEHTDKTVFQASM